MRLLDLFCGAGGAAMGYHRAGFDTIVGVDIKPQKHYPFTFIQADALEFLRDHGQDYDVIHASPPCQAYTKAAKEWRKKGRLYADYILELRDLLSRLKVHYVIENVPGAPLINPIVLNGHLFGLRVHRRRWFECNFPVDYPLLPQSKQPIKMGRPIREGDVIQPVGHFSNVPYAQKEMQIDWMGQKELAQAIPPAYTEWIGKQLLQNDTQRKSETDQTLQYFRNREERGLKK